MNRRERSEFLFVAKKETRSARLAALEIVTAWQSVPTIIRAEFVKFVSILRAFSVPLTIAYLSSAKKMTSTILNKINGPRVCGFLQQTSAYPRLQIIL